MTPSDAGSGLTQSARILQQQARAQRAFNVQVVISWFILLGLLLFLFSGLVIDLGPIHIQTIKLDTEFIQTWIGFITAGVPQTLLISFLAIIFASILALLTALARLSRIPPVYALATFYTSLIRGTPLLVQIFFFFLVLPELGIVLPGFAAGVIALSLNYGAYMSEIFRAGIISVGKGQREAAFALGMTNRQMLRRIVLPQALRVVVPPVGNEFIAMLKDSSLVSATGFVQELLWRATKVGRANFHSLEALLIAALWYWGMTIIFTYLQARLEQRTARGDR